MTRQLRFVTLDVFTTKTYQGNPLAVVFLPDSSQPSLTQRQKQTIAFEFNLSETIFVHAGTGSERTIDIFTVSSEIPFAGHPTIGAASWFLCHSPNTDENEKEVVQKLLTKAGEIPIARQPDPQAPNAVAARVAHNVHIHANGFPLNELVRLYPSMTPYFPTTAAAAADGGALPLFSVVKGMNQLFVELPSLEALGAVTTASGGENIPVEYLDEGWREGRIASYFFVKDVEDATLGRKVIRTRMVLGNLEDPATGSAASGLVSYLSLLEGKPGHFKYDIVQGVEMGRRSDIGVEVVVKEVGKIDSLLLKGSAVKVSEGQIVVPEE